MILLVCGAIFTGMCNDVPVVILCLLGINVQCMPELLKTKWLLVIESFFVGLQHSVVIDDTQASYVISNRTLTEYLIFCQSPSQKQDSNGADDSGQGGK